MGSTSSRVVAQQQALHVHAQLVVVDVLPAPGRGCPVGRGDFDHGPRGIACARAVLDEPHVAHVGVWVPGLGRDEGHDERVDRGATEGGGVVRSRRALGLVAADPTRAVGVARRVGLVEGQTVDIVDLWGEGGEVGKGARRKRGDLRAAHRARKTEGWSPRPA